MPPIDRAKLATALAQLKAPKQPRLSLEEQLVADKREMLDVARRALRAADVTKDPVKVRAALAGMADTIEMLERGQSGGVGNFTVIVARDEREGSQGIDADDAHEDAGRDAAPH